MKHPDWPLFLAAICAEPDEDTPRLVAADFLEENGEGTRAVFIRIQIALARLESSQMGQSLEADKWRKKERAFLGPLSTGWRFWALDACPELVHMPSARRTTSPLAHLHVEGAERLTWQRGFVEIVRCPAEEWLRHGISVRRRNPVRQVILTVSESLPRDAWYAGLDALRGLRAIWVHPSTLPAPPYDFESWLQEWLPGTKVNRMPS